MPDIFSLEYHYTLLWRSRSDFYMLAKTVVYFIYFAVYFPVSYVNQVSQPVVIESVVNS